MLSTGLVPVAVGSGVVVLVVLLVALSMRGRRGDARSAVVRRDLNQAQE